MQIPLEFLIPFCHNLDHSDRLLFVLGDKGLIKSDTSPKIYPLYSVRCNGRVVKQKITKYPENNDRIAIPQKQSLFYGIFLLKA